MCRLGYLLASAGLAVIFEASSSGNASASPIKCPERFRVVCHESRVNVDGVPCYRCVPKFTTPSRPEGTVSRRARPGGLKLVEPDGPRRWTRWAHARGRVAGRRFEGLWK